MRPPGPELAMRYGPTVSMPTSAQGRLHNFGLFDVRRQPGDQVQASGNARRLEPGQPPGQCRQQGVTATAVNRAHAPQVTVELTARDELSQCQLVQGRRRSEEHTSELQSPDHLV